jgi:hypothetical protein
MAETDKRRNGQITHPHTSKSGHASKLGVHIVLWRFVSLRLVYTPQFPILASYIRIRLSPTRSLSLSNHDLPFRYSFTDPFFFSIVTLSHFCFGPRKPQDRLSVLTALKDRELSLFLKCRRRRDFSFTPTRLLTLNTARWVPSGPTFILTFVFRRPDPMLESART